MRSSCSSRQRQKGTNCSDTPFIRVADLTIGCTLWRQRGAHRSWAGEGSGASAMPVTARRHRLQVHR